MPYICLFIGGAISWVFNNCWIPSFLFISISVVLIKLIPGTVSLQSNMWHYHTKTTSNRGASVSQKSHPRDTGDGIDRERRDDTEAVDGDGVDGSQRVLTSADTHSSAQRSRPTKALHWLLALCSPLLALVQIMGAFSWRNSVFESKGGLKYSHHRSCEKVLNTLDDTFDRRRNVRRKVTQNITARFNERKRKFDLFEPEAVCFSDERFGSSSKERYNTFGDGMMIYVVVRITLPN